MVKYRRAKSAGILLGASVLSAHALFCFALPIGVLGGAILALTVFYFYIGSRRALAVAISIAAATLAFEAILRIPWVKDASYYRPHERLTVMDHDMGHRRYKRNQSMQMRIPYGDLRGMSFAEDVPIEPRQVTFNTDSFGFRNTLDYHAQKLVLVGDSFVVGNGTTQSETLPEQLNATYGIDSYDLAHPGSIESYTKYLQSFERAYGSAPLVYAFLFEGNDFPAQDPTQVRTQLSPGEKFLSRLVAYTKIFSRSKIYRLISLRASWNSNQTDEHLNPVFVRTLAGRAMAFYRPYVSVAERRFELNDPEIEHDFEALAAKVDHIFFIPTKYRVYIGLLDRADGESYEALPNRQWEFVKRMCARTGTDVTDLSPALIEESIRLFPRGQLTFWTDDTHWNGRGISVAAREVASVEMQ